MEPHVLDLPTHLALTSDELARGGAHELAIERIVRCACNEARGYRAERGCGACDGGLLARTERLRVIVPAGVEPGTKLRLRGKGHESIAGGAGDVYVTVELARAAPAKRPIRRRTPTTAAALVAALAAILVAAAAFHASRPALGAPCSRASDCGSGECLLIYENRNVAVLPGHEVNLPPRFARGVCTTACTDDAQCPAEMRCAPVERQDSQFSPLPPLDGIRPNARACAPR